MREVSTPSSENRTENRSDAIVLIARALFENQGFERTTVADIAAQAGIVEGTVFHHFGSKRNLASQVIEHFYEEIIAAQDAGLVGVSGTYERLQFVLRSHLSVLQRYSTFCAFLLRESRSRETGLTQAIRAQNRRYTGVVIELLEQGVSNGEVRSDVSPLLIRNTAYGSLEHALWAHLNDDQPLQVEATADQLTAMLWRGIATIKVAPDEGLATACSGAQDVISGLRLEEARELAQQLTIALGGDDIDN